MAEIKVGDAIVVRTDMGAELTRIIVESPCGIVVINPSSMCVIGDFKTVEELVDFYNKDGFTIVKHIKANKLVILEV